MAFLDPGPSGSAAIDVLSPPASKPPVDASAPKIPEKGATPPVAEPPATPPVPGVVPDTTAGSKEALSKIADLEKLRSEYKAPKPEKAENFQPKPQEMMTTWGAIAIAFAALASRRTRTPMTTALNAAGAAFQGMQQGKQEEFKQQFETWKANTDFAFKTAEFERQAYDDIMSRIDKREDLLVKAGEVEDRGAIAKLKATTESLQDPLTWDAFQRGGMPEVVKWQKTKDEQLRKAKEHSEEVGRFGAQEIALHDLQKDPEFQKADRETRLKMLTDVIGKTNPPKLNSLANQIFTPEKIEERADAIRHYRMKPPSGYFARTEAGQKILDKLAEDPDYNEQNYAQINTAKQNLLKADGNQVRSFSAVAHHLNALDRLGTELTNTEPRMWNSVINKLMTAGGYPQATNFDLAKQIIGTELVKAVVGAGATGGERQLLEEKLDAASSPEQLKGAIDTARQLIQGQVQGFMSKYHTMLEHGWMEPNEIIPDNTLKALGVKSIDELGAPPPTKSPNDVGDLDKPDAVPPATGDPKVEKVSATKGAPPKDAVSTIKAKGPDGQEHTLYKMQDGSFVKEDGTPVQ